MLNITLKRKENEKKINYINIFLTIIPLIAFTKDVNSLKLITEEFPPLNFSNNGKIEGISVDILSLILKKLNSRLTTRDIKILPWDLGYKILKTDKNTVLFTTSKTKERENKFKWAGPFILEKKVLLSKKRSLIKIKSLNELKDYKIGVVEKVTSQNCCKSCL